MTRFTRLFSLLLCALLLTAALGGGLTATAADLDEIVSYSLTVTPYLTDEGYGNGSLYIHCAIDWKVLDSTSEGPLEWVQIGVPNSNIPACGGLSGTISDLYVDGDYLKIYFDRSYEAGETVHFEYYWVQQYMYTQDNAAVQFVYTPGWFDQARVDTMTLIWDGSATPDSVGYSWQNDGGVLSGQSTENGVCTLSLTDLPHGARLTLTADYTSWPTQLSPEMSAQQMPDNSWYSSDSGESDGGGFGIFFVFLLIVVLFIVIRAAAAAGSDSWDGGFGVHYVFLGGLYYPAGPDGRPRPGSVGVKNRPVPPPGGVGGGGRSGGGLGGGGRSGGGFGGGGRSGGGCACASSCACACACACAGGGRAGCSAKNLYGAIHLPKPDGEEAPQSHV